MFIDTQTNPDTDRVLRVHGAMVPSVMCGLSFIINQSIMQIRNLSLFKNINESEYCSSGIFRITLQ